MDDWIRRRLEEAGYIDAATGATRTARHSTCPSCGHRVIRGIDADWCGRAVDVDPQPLSGSGELLAILSKLVTFELMLLGNRPELGRRDQWRIRGRPADADWPGDVLVSHRCRRPPWPASAHRRSALTPTPIRPPPTTVDEPAPF